MPENLTDNDGDGLVDEPRSHPERPGPWFVFQFDQKQSHGEITIIDADDDDSLGRIYVELYGEVQSEIEIPNHGDNSIQTLSFDGANYDQLKVRLGGSGGVVSAEVRSRAHPAPRRSRAWA